MLNLIIQIIFPKQLKFLKFPLFCLMINLGLLTLDYTHQSNRANASVVIPASNSAVTPTSILPAQDGIYLYSQSSQPNQLGQGYVIFQKQQERVSRESKIIIAM